jgi:hypothetical protein
VPHWLVGWFVGLLVCWFVCFPCVTIYYLFMTFFVEIMW